MAKEPDRVDARSNLGAAFVRLGRYEDAVVEYRRALEIEPELAAVRFNLALALYKSARSRRRCRSSSGWWPRTQTNTAALLLLADCELQAGHDARVIELLEPREGELKQDRLYCYLMGNALIRTSEFLRGQAFIDRLLRDGDTAPARLLMGVAHLRREDAGQRPPRAASAPPSSTPSSPPSRASGAAPSWNGPSRPRPPTPSARARRTTPTTSTRTSTWACC